VIPAVEVSINKCYLWQGRELRRENLDIPKSKNPKIEKSKVEIEKSKVKIEKWRVEK